MNWIHTHINNILIGLLFSIVGYFAPIRGVITVMVAAIIIDLFFGIWAARHRGEGIKSCKLWRTAYKLFIAVVIVSLMFSIDREIGSKLIELHTVLAWMITGFEVWSILESAGQITNHRLFRILKRFMEDKFMSVSGLDIEGEKDESYIDED